MNYLLIEERAWNKLQNHIRHMTERLRQMERYLIPATEDG